MTSKYSRYIGEWLEDKYHGIIRHHEKSLKSKWELHRHGEKEAEFIFEKSDLV